jgi:hypothetical protein
LGGRIRVKRSEEGDTQACAAQIDGNDGRHELSITCVLAVSVQGL